jgi:hypothetical protein
MEKDSYKNFLLQRQHDIKQQIDEFYKELKYIEKELEELNKPPIFIIKRGSFIEFEDLKDYNHLYMGEVYKVTLNNKNKKQYHVIIKGGRFFPGGADPEEPVQENQIRNIITESQYGWTLNGDWRKKYSSDGKWIWDLDYIHFRNKLFNQPSILDGTLSSKKKRKNKSNKKLKKKSKKNEKTNKV